MFDIDTMVEGHATAVQPRTAATVMEPKFFCTVTPFYQPIVSANGFGVIGYEALARGPLDSPLHSARTLFATADGLGERAALERVCWTTALLNATRLGLWRRPDTLLFLTVGGAHPRTRVPGVRQARGGRDGRVCRRWCFPARWRWRRACAARPDFPWSMRRSASAASMDCEERMTAKNDGKPPRQRAVHVRERR